MNKEEVIEKLNLQPHEMEGGYYRETYRSDDIINSTDLPDRYEQDKSIFTAIYFMLTPDTFSAMHRIPSDEMFHFYAGDPIEMLVLEEGKNGEIVNKGNDLLNSVPQYVVTKGNWQGSRLKAGGKFALLGVTVTPGFDFSDFEIGNANDLIKKFPYYKDKILSLSR